MKELPIFNNISNKNKYDENPRTITKKQFGLLKEHIEELGDLSGVVYCHKNKAFVSGNQRSEIFNGAEIEIVEKFDKPTRRGTVAYGFITYNGEKYAYREVYFMKSRFEMACIVANYDGGSFDWDIIANKFDELDLTKWGVKVWKTEEIKRSTIGRSLLIAFNPEDIVKAKELVEHFKSNEIYIGGEILEKLQLIK